MVVAKLIGMKLLVTELPAFQELGIIKVMIVFYYVKETYDGISMNSSLETCPTHKSTT